MGRSQNRSYKRGEPHRDARLFIVVAEGEREDQYFGFFVNKSLRLKIEIVPREQGNSSPKDFLNRVTKYLQRDFDLSSGKKGQDNDIHYDYLWFVLDVDRWPREQIDDIAKYCQDTESWFLCISNPCFEVWLHNHIESIPQHMSTPAQLKEALGKLSPGGYSPKVFAPLIAVATERSKDQDQHPNHYFPEPRQTKVYALAEKILQLLGNTWND